MRGTAAVVVLGLAAWILGGSAPRSSAAGLRDLEDGWLLGGRAVDRLLGDGSAPASPGAGTWLMTGQARLFGMDDLAVAAIRAGLAGGGGRWALEGAWQQTGGGVYRAGHERLRLDLGRWRRIGLVAVRRHLDLGSTPPMRHVAAGATADAVFRLAGSTVTLGVRVPLTPAPPWQVHGGREPWLAASVAGPGYGLALVVDRNADGRPGVGFETAMRLQATLALCLRGDPGTGALGPGLIWRRRGLRLRTSHLVHPFLGATHRFEIGLGRPGASPW